MLKTYLKVAKRTWRLLVVIFVFLFITPAFASFILEKRFILWFAIGFSLMGSVVLTPLFIIVYETDRTDEKGV